MLPVYALTGVLPVRREFVVVVGCMQATFIVIVSEIV